MLRRLWYSGATSLEAAHLANFSFSSAGARRVWPSQVVVQVLVLVVPGPAGPRQAPVLHCTGCSLQWSPPLLQCAPVSLAPTTPQSSSPALLAAIAKPRAGIHIQLDAWWMQRDTTIPNNLMLQSLETFAVCFLVCPVSRWWVGCVGRLVGRAGVPQPQPCPTLAGGAHRLTSGHNSCVSCVICSTLKLFSFQDRARLRLIQNVHKDQF